MNPDLTEVITYLHMQAVKIQRPMQFICDYRNLCAKTAKTRIIRQASFIDQDLVVCQKTTCHDMS